MRNCNVDIPGVLFRCLLSFSWLDLIRHAPVTQDSSCSGRSKFRLFWLANASITKLAECGWTFYPLSDVRTDHFVVRTAPKMSLNYSITGPWRLWNQRVWEYRSWRLRRRKGYTDGKLWKAVCCTVISNSWCSQWNLFQNSQQELVINPVEWAICLNHKHSSFCR